MNTAEIWTFRKVQGDQKVSVHLMMAIHMAGAHRLFDHPVYRKYLEGFEMWC